LIPNNETSAFRSKWLGEEEKVSPTSKSDMRKSELIEMPRKGITVLDTREGLDLVDVVKGNGSP